ncbi:MAG: type II secretion system F family protein [Candidatus Aenigmarchaeota archaeon]|nr:type II secretion system F family protein [Candidatus Aenigmarchaeota archaeon]
MYHQASKILPERIRNNYKSLLQYCDIQISPEMFIGFILLFGIGVSFAVSLNLMVIFSYAGNTFILVFLLTYVLFEIIVYLLLLLRADAKGKYVEGILPDVLLLTSMNIKSGITTDRALIMTALPEFGPLKNELNRAGKQILAGKPIKHALLEMTGHIKSKLFERTIRLIIEGIENGGELSDLLQQTSTEIQNMKIVQNEVRANVLMYAIFIFFAAGIGAPILFGISTYLAGVGLTKNPLGGEFLVTFALLSLAVTSFFAGLIIGIIKDGNEKAGVKFIPILLTVSIFVFFSIRSVVSGILPAFGTA